MWRLWKQLATWLGFRAACAPARELGLKSPHIARMRTIKSVGAAAEYAVNKFMTEHGWRSLPCKLPGGQGFDHVFVRYADYSNDRRLLIVETKANSSPLTEGQMSAEWIDRKLQAMMASKDRQLQATADIVWECRSWTTNPYSDTCSLKVVRVTVEECKDAYEVLIRGDEICAEVRMPTARVVVPTAEGMIPVFQVSLHEFEEDYQAADDFDDDTVAEWEVPAVNDEDGREPGHWHYGARDDS